MATTTVRLRSNGQAKDMMMWWCDRDTKVGVSSKEQPNLVVLPSMMVCNGGMKQKMAWVEEREMATLAAIRGGCCGYNEVDLWVVLEVLLKRRDVAV